MFKKITLILFALIIFSIPYQQQYVEGAIFSKVASVGAKKVVKEVIKETAFELAMNIFVEEAFKMADADKAKYQAQADYETFCGKKMPDLITCEKPMQMKKVISEADKTNIGNQAEIELDKLITNGKGFTRWQKFLDWFIPIWITSFALTAITYAVDPEVRSLFNEAGYNALVALGLIKPAIGATQSQPSPVEELETSPPTQTQSNIFTKVNTVKNEKIHSYALYFPSRLPIDMYTTTYFTEFNNVSTYSPMLSSTWYSLNKGDITYGAYFGTVQSLTMKTGDKVLTMPNYQNGQAFTGEFWGLQNNYMTKVQSVTTRFPYILNGSYYTDILLKTTDGLQMQYQLKHTAWKNTESTYIHYSTTNLNYSASSTQTSTIYTDVKPYKEILVPQYEELETPLQFKTKYENDYKQMTLPPPSALPYKQISTGEELTPRKLEDGSGVEFIKPDGTPVTDENDIAVGEPKITTGPTGQPQVEPPPSPSNPTPQPIPLTPPPAPPKTTPPIETETPIFPEGESCDVGLKLPKFNPLLHTISEAFPFSIPFDLKDGFDAIFAEMGSEKPEFDYKLNFMGEEQSWKITIPDYFDSWKNFTDSFLVFIFDVGIIYAIYRFMSGGGS